VKLKTHNTTRALAIMGFLYRTLGVLPRVRRGEMYSIIPFAIFPYCSLYYVDY
jgi:hypothetical protein